MKHHKYPPVNGSQGGVFWVLFLYVFSSIFKNWFIWFGCFFDESQNCVFFLLFFWKISKNLCFLFLYFLLNFHILMFFSWVLTNIYWIKTSIFFRVKNALFEKKILCSVRDILLVPVKKLRKCTYKIISNC